jgi:hypothetical protein
MSRVGQVHTFIGIYGGVHTVFLRRFIHMVMYSVGIQSWPTLQMRNVSRSDVKLLSAL